MYLPFYSHLFFASENLVGLFSHFSHSAKHMHQFKQFQAFCEVKPHFLTMQLLKDYQDSDSLFCYTSQIGALKTTCTQPRIFSIHETASHLRTTFFRNLIISISFSYTRVPQFNFSLKKCFNYKEFLGHYMKRRNW